MIRFAAASLAFLMQAAPALALEFEPNAQAVTDYWGGGYRIYAISSFSGLVLARTGKVARAAFCA